MSAKLFRGDEAALYLKLRRHRPCSLRTRLPHDTNCVLTTTLADTRRLTHVSETPIEHTTERLHIPQHESRLISLSSSLAVGDRLSRELFSSGWEEGPRRTLNCVSAAGAGMEHLDIRPQACQDEGQPRTCVRRKALQACHCRR